MIDRILSKVPAYEYFYTVDELNESSRRLAAEHPELVRIETVGGETPFSAGSAWTRTSCGSSSASSSG